MARISAITHGSGTRGASLGTTIFIRSSSRRLSRRGLDGRQTLRAMILLDEIRGRLAEVFALRTHKIDHVAARRDRLGGRVWRDPRRDGRSDRVGGWPCRGALRSVSCDSRRASIVGLERGVGRHFSGSRGAFGPPRDAGLCRAGGHLSQSRGDFLSVREAARPRRKPVRFGAGDRRATISQSWGCTSSSGCTSTSRRARSPG